MDAEKLLKQGMEMAEKLRGTAGEQVERHEGQIKDTLGKITEFVNEKTGGKYTDQVSKAASFLERGVDMMAAQSPGPQGSGEDSSSTPPPASPAPPSGPEGAPKADMGTPPRETPPSAG
jgi:hypothetical protein